MVQAGLLNRRVNFRQRAPMTNTPGVLRVGYVNYGSQEWAAYDDGRPATIPFFDLNLTAKSGTVTVRDSSFTRSLTREHRVVVDDEEFEITAIAFPARPDGAISISVVSIASRASFAREVEQRGEEITIRRVTSTGPAIEKTVRAIVSGYTPDELVGGITQVDRKLTISAEDLEREPNPFPLPLRRGGSDKAVVRGQLMTLEDIDDSSMRMAGQLIAYRVRAKG